MKQHCPWLAAIAGRLRHCRGCCSGRSSGCRGRKPAIPQFQVDALWPKPLPNNWILGQVAGITVDRFDRIWVVQRPGSLTPRERAAEQNPPSPSAASPRRRSWCSTSPATW